MTENPHDKEDLPRKDEKLCKEKSSTKDKEETRDYYDDDAHGYEIYQADEDDEEN